MHNKDYFKAKASFGKDFMDVWAYKHPELRITQLVYYLAKLGGWENNDIFYCPDEVILKGLQKFNNEN